jgi:radical SAM protein with 4Fe4S-binding SPASM domain
METLTAHLKSEPSPIDKVLAAAKNQLKPVNTFIELTYRCNLDCVHCYCIRGAGRPELTPEEWKKFIKHTAEEGGLIMAFSGGEILVYPGFFEVYDYANSLGFAVKLKTNGTLITPEIADKIAAGYPTEVDVSILGGNDSTHDRMTRVRRSHDKAWEGIRLLRERGVRVCVNTSITQDNFSKYDNVKDMAKGLGCATNCDVNIHVKNDGDKNVQQYSMEKDAFRKFTDRLPIGMLGPKPHANPNSQLMCNAGRGHFSMNPYGDITTCNPMQLPLGHVKTDSWADVRRSQLLKRIVSLTLQDLPECKACEYREYCQRCHAVAWQDSGSITAKSIHACRKAKMLKGLYQERLKKEGSHVES